MPNKNISNFDLGTPVTGDYLLMWDVSEGRTKKVYINRVVALAPDEAETFLFSGVTGGRNVGPGEGTVYHSTLTNAIRFKTIKAGTNISITNNTGDVTISASLTTPESGNLNVGAGEGTIFHSNENNFTKFKTIKAGSNISITNNTGDVTISSSAGAGGVSMVMTTGRGDSHLVLYGGEDLATFNWTAIDFGGGDPVLSIPAGNGNYLIDFIFGVRKGSSGQGVYVKLVDTTNSRDLPDAFIAIDNGFANGQYHLRVFSGISGPITVRAYAAHGFFDETNLEDPIRMPQIISTGTKLSYLKF